MVKKKGRQVVGVCRVCHCTDDNACSSGCAWTSPRHDLCSGCSSIPDPIEWLGMRMRDWSLWLPGYDPKRWSRYPIEIGMKCAGLFADGTAINDIRIDDLVKHVERERA